MANNNFSTGKVHVDVNIGLNVNDVKIDQNEFNKAGKDAANAFNNGYQQVPPPSVTPNVNPPAGGGGGGGGNNGNGGRGSRIDQTNILGRQADSWRLRREKAADNGADAALLAIIDRVQDAFDDWEHAPDSDRIDRRNDFNFAVREASRELNKFNYNLKSATQLVNNSIRIDNQVVSAGKTAKAWAKRGDEVSKNNVGGSYASQLAQINGVQNAFANVQNATSIEELNWAMRDFRAAVDTASDAYDEFKQRLADTTSIEKSKKEFENLETQFRILSRKNGSIENWSDVMQYQAGNVDAAHSVFEALNQNKSQDPVAYANALANYKKSIDLVNASLTQMDSMHGTVAGSLSSMTKSMLGTSIAMKAFSYGRRALSDMVKEVTAIDSAMVNLRKVTDASDSAYQSFLDNAGDKARELGSTITDLIDATSAFAKMGYTLGEAEGLGQIATMFAGAADFSGAEEAASVLISAVNGFADLEISDAESVADKLNEVSNRFAVTATDLSEGLTRSASALSAGGNSIDQTIAMLTTIAEVTRNASEAGSALKVLALRLRGAKVELESAGEDTEGMADSTAKLREQVAALTNVSGKGGVDIMADSKNFKETYQIMSEISKVWNDMSDIDQAALLELIAGKVRSNQVAALLSNMAKADSVLATSLGAENSVLREHTRWLDSIEAKQKQLTASWQEFSKTVIDSGLVKGAYDAGSGLLGYLTKIADTFGAGNIATGGIVSGLISRGAGGNAWDFIRAHFGKQGTADQSVINAYNTSVLDNASASDSGRGMLGMVAATKQAKTLGRELTLLEKTLISNAKGNQIYTTSLTGISIAAQKAGAMLKNLAMGTAVTAAITVAMWGIGKLVENIEKEANAAKYAMEEVEEKQGELTQVQSELQAINNELATTQTRMDELNAKGKLTFVEKGELAELKATNAELKAQKELYEQIEKTKAEELFATQSAAYREKYGDGMLDTLPERWSRERRELYDVTGEDEGVMFAATKRAADIGANDIDSYAVAMLRAESELETVTGYAIKDMIDSLAAFEKLKLQSEDIYDDGEWATVYNQYATVRRKLAEELKSIDAGLTMYEDAGRYNDETYLKMLEYRKMMVPALGAGYEDYYRHDVYNRAINNELYGERVSNLIDRYASGKISENELRENLEQLQSFTDWLNLVWIGKDPLGSFIDNAIANVNEGIATLNAASKSSAYETWKEVHDKEESGAVYDDALTALNDLIEGLKSGRVGTKEYAAAQEFLLGDGKYSKDSEELLKRYLTDDISGVVNFQQDLMKAGLMNKDGTMISGADTESVARILSISEELANALFMKANEYIADESKKYVVGDRHEPETPIDPVDKNTNAIVENTKALISLKDIIKLDKKSGGNTNDGEGSGDGYDSPVDDPMLGNQRTVSSGIYQVRKDAGMNVEPGGLDKYNATVASENVYLSADEVVIREKLSDPSIDPETEFNALFGNNLGSERSAAFASYMDMINSGDTVEQALRKMINDVNQGVYGDLGLVFKTTDISPEAEAELNDILKPEEKIVWVKFVDGRVGDVRDTKFLYGDNSAFGSSDEPHYIHSKGTDNAIAGTHLVDEQGAELIEHTSDGTYELGTNRGPRMAKLKDGDIVHTAEETKEILARKARRRGRGFAAGNGLFKGHFGGGGNGASLTGSLSHDHNYTKDIGSAVYIPVTGIDGGIALDPPDPNNGGDNSAANKIKKALKWAEGLVDWIPRALEVLKDKTEAYVREAEKSIGFLAQNTKVDKAISNVRNEIELNMAAHARYMKQANDFAQRAGLSDDIIKLIHEGTIDIREYDENTRSVISEYEKWYEKANGCLDTIISLEDQMESLAQQKLDNIVGYFDNLNGLLDQQIESYQGLIDVKKAYGKELVEDDYYQMIADSEETVRNMVEEQKALSEELNYLVGAGLIQTGSDAWYEYATRIEELNSSISDAKVSISELSDEMNNLTLVNLQTGMKYLEDVQKSIESVGNLQDSQGKSRGVVQYRQLISIGMKQIDNLEMQNKEILKQMDGLDVLSEKYQELNDALKENQLSIMDIKSSQEEWNDSIIDLKLDALQKQNDIYQQRLNIMDALNGIEDARQRRVSVYKEGVGFTYEADQDAMREARNNLDSAMYDLLTQQLEASKEADNIYDSIGNQLVEVKDALTSVDFSKYYDSISSDMTNSKILSDALASANLGDIIAGAAGGGIQIDLSGMTLNNVNSVEDLGNAIVDQLPTYILQFMHEK